ncbi:MAG: adenosine kinase, partial [Burkholderiaceae bacterium]
MATLDVVGIGNAIVDVIVRADDEFLIRQSLAKGSMQLVDELRADALTRDFGAAQVASGGSVCNTIAALAGFGAAAGYIGRVHDDELGRRFRRDLDSLGVAFPASAAQGGPLTARCVVLVTPDAQRTMCTYLGACVELAPQDLDGALIAAAQVTLLEGYLYDPPLAKQAFDEAAAIAHRHGRKVALSLSDAFCVERHRADFLRFIDANTDLLFANEAEVLSLFETDDLGAALDRLRGMVDTAAVTLGARGSVILREGKTWKIDPVPVETPVDTTGAGDCYAAGFLYGYVRQASPEACGRLGSAAASAVIRQVGARLPAGLHATLLAQTG